MEALELDFEQAKTRHLLFKTKLRSILYGAEIDEQPVLSHYECAVGKWIYSHALKEYGHIPEMQQLEKVHANIHVSARELIALYKEGKVEEARKGLSSMELIADNLVALLSVIEMKLKLANHPNNDTVKDELLSINYKELLELHNTIRDLDVRIRAQNEELYSARKKVNETLQNNFSQAPMAICVLRGKDFFVELANELYLQLVDRGEDFIGKPLFASLPELEGQGIREMLSGVLETGKPFIGNEVELYVNRNKTKEKGFFNFVYQPLREEGIITGIMVVCTEVTMQIIAKLKTEESERRLAVAIESAELGTFELNLKTNERILSERYLNVLGYKGSDTPSHADLLERVAPEYIPIREKAMEKALKTGILTHEMRIIWKDGTEHWIKATGTVFYDEEKRPERLLGTVIDITENRLNQEKIIKSNRKLEIALEAGSLGSYEIEFESRKCNFSATCKENYGFHANDEVSLDDVASVLHPDDKIQIETIMGNAIKEGKNYTTEYRVILKDKSVRWISSSGKGVYDADGKPIKLIGVNANITKRKKAEEELSLSVEKFKLLSDSMPQFIWTGDAAGNLNYYNQAVFDYSGLSLEQINAEGWLQIVHPDDRPRNIEKWIHSITTGEDFLFEHRFRKHTGEYRWQLSRAVPQKNTEGEIQMWVGTSTDIHDQKELAQQLESLVVERTKELKQANIELEITNQELSSFAYISSHDLQEPLRKIQTFVSRIKESDFNNLTTNGKNYFNRVQSSAEKMKTLINDLLTYSRTSAAEKVFEKTDLGLLLEEVKNEFNDALTEKKGSISFSSLPVIKVIPFQFRQLFINLISNAIKFSKADIPLEIKINSKQVKGSDINNRNAHHQDTYIHISVGDNGIGFDKEYESKIFEVFQKLHSKHEYEGTGIGLSICKKIAENHNGFITAQSELNKGANFNIYVPISLN